MPRSGDLGWAGWRIWERGKGLETSQKGKSRKELLQTEDEGNSPVKVAAVLGVLLVVAACQDPPTLVAVERFGEP